MMALNMMVYTADTGFSMLPYMLGALGVLLIVAGIKTRSIAYVTCALVFGVYLLFVIDKVFFPLHVAGGFAEMMRTIPFETGVNFIPFYVSSTATLESVLWEWGLNLVLLVPFGFGISFLVPLRPKQVLWLAPLVGLSLEVMQLLIGLMVGYPYRVIDINDAIMNTLGFWVGYGLFRLFALGYVMMIARMGVTPRGLGEYVYTVARRGEETDK